MCLDGKVTIDHLTAKTGRLTRAANVWQPVAVCRCNDLERGCEPLTVLAERRTLHLVLHRLNQAPYTGWEVGHLDSGVAVGVFLVGVYRVQK